MTFYTVYKLMEEMAVGMNEIIRVDEEAGGISGTTA